MTNSSTAIKKIGLMTSGGDSPGMNAAVRAIVRTSICHNITPIGIMRGYQGMIENDMKELSSRDVSNIIQRGGTILKTARSKEFMTTEGMYKAYTNLKENEIDALILIGGDGTIKGAIEFFKQYSIPSIALPGTIDNDINGTDYTIGFDTAVNTAMESIDKIRDTASSHNRIFLVEVMGRDAGYIALYSGLACGAEHIFIPEQQEALDIFIDTIQKDQNRKKQANIIVVAEGDQFGGAEQLKTYLQKQLPDIDSRVTILGHIQRGGSPTCSDRILASRLGQASVEYLIKGESQKMAGMINGNIVLTDYALCVKAGKPIAEDFIRMIYQLR